MNIDERIDYKTYNFKDGSDFTSLTAQIYDMLDCCSQKGNTDYCPTEPEIDWGENKLNKEYFDENFVKIEDEFKEIRTHICDVKNDMTNIYCSTSNHLNNNINDIKDNVIILKQQFDGVDFAKEFQDLNEQIKKIINE